MTTIILRRWRLVEVGGGVNSHHLVGFAKIPGTSYAQGRVSSPVVSFHRGSMTAITRSGNRYELAGPKDRDRLGELVLTRWLLHYEAEIVDGDCDLDVLPPERLS